MSFMRQLPAVIIIFKHQMLFIHPFVINHRHDYFPIVFFKVLSDNVKQRR